MSFLARTLLYSSVLLLCSSTAAHYTLIIESPCNSHNPGRVIDDCFEYNIIQKFATQLQTSLELYGPALTVLNHTTRNYQTSDERIQTINKCNPDIVIVISCCQRNAPETAGISFGCMPTDKTTQDIVSLKQIHKHYSALNRACIEHFYTTCAKKLNVRNWTTYKPLAAPCTQLTGIDSIALHIELGLTDNNQWRLFVKPLMQAITEWVDYVQRI